MAEAAQPKMTVDAFLRWAEGREGRYELVDGEVVRLPPDTAGTARTRLRAALALDRAVRRAGVACEVFPRGAAVRLHGTNARLPDVLLVCGPRLRDDALEAPNPVVVVEVVSPSSASVDRGRKLVDWFRLPSLRHWLVVDPDRRVVVHHERTDSEIRTRILADGRLHLDPPGIGLEVEDLFGSAPGWTSVPPRAIRGGDGTTRSREVFGDLARSGDERELTFRLGSRTRNRGRHS